MDRFTISLDAQLARQFEALVRERRFASRSAAVRELIHLGLHQAQRQPAVAEPDGARQVTAALDLLLDSRDPAARDRLDAWRRDHRAWTAASTEFELDERHRHCLLLLRGPWGALQAAAARLIDGRGIRRGEIRMLLAQGYDGEPRRYEVPAVPSYERA